MKIISMKEKTPENDGLYLTINKQGLLGVCKWEDNKWYTIPDNQLFDPNGKESWSIKNSLRISDNYHWIE
jgi:hypothetical protein